jgi:hypothetical protein
MAGIQDIHRAETIAYVLGAVRELHKGQLAWVDIYARQPHAAALELIARDRAHRAGQLVAAIEAGLYDRLDAAEAEQAVVAAAIAVTDSGRSTQDFIGMLPRAVEPGLTLETLPAHELRVGDVLALSGTGWCTVDRVDVENDDDGTTVAVLFTAPDGQIRTLRTMGSEIKPILRPKDSKGTTGFALGDLVNVSDPEHEYFGVRGKVTVIHGGNPVGVTIKVTSRGETLADSVNAKRYVLTGDELMLPASSLMHHCSFIARPQEFFDAAEAADVAQIQHEMDVEAGAECDPETCVYCGGA